MLVDVEVDVRADSRPGLAQPVADAGPAAVELVDRRIDRRRFDLDVPLDAREERHQRSWEVQVGHG
jgi:hypothetical protein